jgi:CopG-like RHH_1 or ribbon-helix-helix domain, RHH_5
VTTAEIEAPKAERDAGLHVLVSQDVRDRVVELAASERRSISSMAFILLDEALAARGTEDGVR